MAGGPTATFSAGECVIRARLRVDPQLPLCAFKSARAALPVQGRRETADPSLRSRMTVVLINGRGPYCHLQRGVVSQRRATARGSEIATMRLQVGEGCAACSRRKRNRRSFASLQDDSGAYQWQGYLLPPSARGSKSAARDCAWIRNCHNAPSSRRGLRCLFKAEEKPQILRFAPG